MKNLLFSLLFFLVSCNIKEKSHSQQSTDDIISFDSIQKWRYHIKGNATSGLYKIRKLQMNLCVYDGEYNLHIPSYLNKSHFSQKIVGEKAQEIGTLPNVICTYENKMEKILFYDIDSLQRVYYELIDYAMPQASRQVGKLHLLYENEDAGNYGIRLFVSDTTEKYGFFTVQTIISKDLHKNLPLQEKMMNEDAMIIKSSQNKNIEGIYAKIGLPYRIILDDEVKAKQHSSIILE